MDWNTIIDQARQVAEAHKDATPVQLATMLQAQFRDVPMIGWFLLRSLHAGGALDNPKVDGE
jgi:hypothetical protein